MGKDLTELRREYVASGLHEDDVSKDPLHQFENWFNDVLKLEIELANAMVLATSNSDGLPSARYVLLKDYSKDGFVFYTSSLSQKGRHLHIRPQAALVFYWKEVHRQVRIEGSVELLAAEVADRFFESRPRGSQISAWVATQSDTIPAQEFMHEKVKELTHKFHDKPVPRPDSWLGYRVKPHRYEFWQGQENRLHDRIVYQSDNSGGWSINRLAP